MALVKVPQKLNLPTLIGAGLLITIVVGLTALFWGRSLIGHLLTNNKILSKKRQAEQQLSKNIQALSSLSDDYNNLGDNHDRILDALPTTSDFPSIVSMMENLSKNAGVSLLSVTPADTQSASGTTNVIAKTGPTSYLFNATISGSYDSFKSFLQDVELSSRPLSITTMKINGNSALLSIDLTIKTYYQAPYSLTPKTVPLQ